MLPFLAAETLAVPLVVDGTTYVVGGNETYDYIIVKNGGTITTSTNYTANLTALVNITVDATSTISGSGPGGGPGIDTNGGCSPGTEQGGGGSGSGPAGIGGGSSASGNGGGGGGGHASTGSTGAGSSGGAGGSEYGSMTSDNYPFAGSGGGAGGGSSASQDGSFSKGKGGGGGGGIRLEAPFIYVRGTVTTSGGGGSAGSGTSSISGGGGGSGGEIIFKANMLDYSNASTAIRSDGGSGGAKGTGGSCATLGDGGAGSGGRLKFFYVYLSNSSATVSASGGTLYWNNISNYQPPQMFNIVEPTDNLNFSARQYTFTADIRDGDNATDIRTVYFETNMCGSARNLTVTNYTTLNDTFRRYNVSLDNCEAETSSYKWYANDSYYNFTSSASNTYTIHKGVLQASISCLPGISVNQSDVSTCFYNETNIGDSDVNYNFYRNTTSVSQTDNTTLAKGTHVYVFNTSAGTFSNWTSNSSIHTLTLTVTDIQSPNMSSLTITPTSNTPENVINLRANVQDNNSTISAVIAQVINPDGNRTNYTLSFDSVIDSNYPVTNRYARALANTETVNVGTYYVEKWYANDSEGNTRVSTDNSTFSISTEQPVSVIITGSGGGEDRVVILAGEFNENATFDLRPAPAISNFLVSGQTFRQTITILNTGNFTQTIIGSFECESVTLDLGDGKSVSRQDESCKWISFELNGTKSKTISVTIPARGRTFVDTVLTIPELEDDYSRKVSIVFDNGIGMKRALGYDLISPSSVAIFGPIIAFSYTKLLPFTNNIAGSDGIYGIHVIILSTVIAFASMLYIFRRKLIG